MSRKIDEEDARFFLQHPDRQTHIREPIKAQEVTIDAQRAAMYVDEAEQEFRSLGGHQKSRRRILLYRIPPDNPFYDPQRPALMKIPFLLFADETVEDRDDILLPILHAIMENAREQ
jgi:hypothetical protein